MRSELRPVGGAGSAADAPQHSERMEPSHEGRYRVVRVGIRVISVNTTAKSTSASTLRSNI